MIKGKIKAIRGDVLVHNMHFGETKTAGGIIIQSDDAKAHGVKPRWAQVYAKGHENKDPYNIASKMVNLWAASIPSISKLGSASA